MFRKIALALCLIACSRGTAEPEAVPPANPAHEEAVAKNQPTNAARIPDSVLLPPLRQFAASRCNKFTYFVEANQRNLEYGQRAVNWMEQNVVNNATFKREADRGREGTMRNFQVYSYQENGLKQEIEYDAASSHVTITACGAAPNSIRVLDTNVDGDSAIVTFEVVSEDTTRLWEMMLEADVFMERFMRGTDRPPLEGRRYTARFNHMDVGGWELVRAN